MEKPRSYGSGARSKKLRRTVLSCLIILFIAAGFAAAWQMYQAGLQAGQLQEGVPQLQEAFSTEAPTAPPVEASPTPTTPPTQAPTAPAESLPPEVSPERALLDAMSLEEKLYQLFMVTPETLSGGETVTSGVDFVEELLQQPVGGIVFFSPNLIDREQCKALLSAYQSSSRTPLLLGVDEEGGSVSRLGSNPAMGVTEFSSMGKIDKTEAAAYTVGMTLGSQLRELGFNLDFAPVADVNTNPNNPVIGNRAFSSDPGTASKMVAACVRGFSDTGLISCLKHFPGHGDTKEDSHLELAASQKTLEELWEAELLPFQAGIMSGAPMIMAGHISLPKVTGSSTPASLSPELITGLLRETLAYEGVVVTDAMNMEAITELYSPGQAAVLALQAGCDLILMPEDLEAAVNALREALEDGRLTMARIEESLLRILKLKVEYGICPTN